ncbi:glycosyl transferase, family 2 [Heliomicrobium modesticaldum Ice1]|uniref:Glycosyl transferase, family 2 n=1 Tax=Heliobacterium modesticaldum (strain ATCC 51547 / Ice1) TaxID=498761 RepID=B0TH13_HELMI|nr:glycosyltransferase [Heliomicrobium modesticaldum]ABZ83338.1 glycosyl transferase, family 2 [Heliomicrobium modesticaldum Ice1]
MELVSVVILNWNRRNDLKEGLTRLREQPYRPLEIIVVDNGSTDDSVAMVRAEFPEVRLIETGKNLGVEGYNAGFRQARGEYVLILDDDSFPAYDAITRMVSRFQADPRLGVVAFDVRSYDQFVQWEQQGRPERSETSGEKAQALAEPDYYMSLSKNPLKRGQKARRFYMEIGGI